MSGQLQLPPVPPPPLPPQPPPQPNTLNLKGAPIGVMIKGVVQLMDIIKYV